MQSRLLRSFLVVAEKSSITKAAEVLHISQPALTKSIMRLEKELGVALFERVPAGMRLTKYGEVLFHHAKVMENEYRHAISRIQELRDGRSGALRIGAGPVWLVSLLPPIVAELQKQQPGVAISLIGGVIDTLVPELINGELDLICVSLDFPNRSEIIKQKLFDIHHVLIADPSHPLASEVEVDALLIHKYPWMVLKSDYVGTERISSFFAANGLEPPKIAFETTSIHSLLQGVKSGSYIAHIPAQMLPLAHMTGLQEIKLKQPIWETTAGYAYRASVQLSEPMKAFMRLLQDINPATSSNLV
ncbi:LysR family transcriptional regulator [Labrenzia sp. CE80]|uniref:LysR family transcriptional regulator n=1 Tax=Labrenzia sp. CE80 TaxID=1788986 RepID=UPI00129A7CAB|nr:LysR family transcriptional regulator [Labrenzia sp. CE80]